VLTALILIIVVAGIVVLARRWPDIEAKLWPDEVNVPEKEARTASDEADTVDVVDEVVVEESVEVVEAEPVVEKTAGGLMSKKALTSEPDVDEAVTMTAADDDEDEAEPEEPASFMDALPDVEDEVEEAKPEPAKEKTEAVKPKAAPAASPTRATPKPRVNGEPARPSQPAYVDATKRVAESFEQLSAEADKAWQERSYDKAEQACLKILVQQPKNHKYMTRIGQIYQETGDLEDAKEAFESAKKLDPKNFFVLNRLSEVERMISDKGGRTNLKKPVTK
jgi:hypothetical protein